MGAARGSARSGSDEPSEGLARTILDRLPGAVLLLAPVRDETGILVDLVVEYHNADATVELGHPAHRLRLARLSELDLRRSGPLLVELCDRALRRDETVSDVLPVRSGMIEFIVRPLDGRALVVAGDTGDPVGAADVEQLRESLETATDHVAMLVPVRDDAGHVVDFQVVYMNDRALQARGLPVDRLLREPVSVAVARYPAFLLDAYRQVLETGVPYVVEMAQALPHGPMPVRLVATRYRSGVIVTVRDLTAEVAARDALAESEARFRSLLDTMTEAVTALAAVRDDNGEITGFEVQLVNPAGARLPPPVVLRPAGTFIARNDPDIGGIMTVLARTVETGEPRTIHVGSLADGIVVEATVVRLGDGVVVVGRDVTERTLQQQRLADSERRFHQLAEHAGDAVFYGQPDGLVWVSPSIEGLLGYHPSELVGHSPTEIVHPDDVGVLLAGRGAYEHGEAARHRIRVRRKDGSYIWVTSIARPIDPVDRNTPPIIVATMWSIQAEVEAQEALARADRERHEAELRLQEALRAESLGVMAGGVAHDFNNLLAGVLGNAELAMLALPQESAARDRVGRIAVAAQRAAELTRTLLDSAGSRSGQVELVDLEEIVVETIRLHESALPESVAIEVSTSGEGAPVLGDPTQLRQLVANLVLNAGDAIVAAERRGTVRVEVRTVELAERTVGAGGDDLPPGRYVTLTVADEGVGMSPLTLLRVFDPFFTTRPSGRGLGLAVVRGVTRAHRGVIVPTSVEGVGTTMTVHLQAAERPPAGRTTVASSEAIGEPSPLVLVVDDDDGVREMMITVLERAGMRVVGAADGRVALDELRKRLEEVAVVLLDLTMPGVGGDEVLVQIRQLRPQLPVVIVSGWSRAAQTGWLAELGADEVVTKPFRPTELVATVRRVLLAPA